MYLRQKKCIFSRINTSLQKNIRFFEKYFIFTKNIDFCEKWCIFAKKCFFSENSTLQKKTSIFSRNNASLQKTCILRGARFQTGIFDVHFLKAFQKGPNSEKHAISKKMRVLGGGKCVSKNARRSRVAQKMRVKKCMSVQGCSKNACQKCMSVQGCSKNAWQKWSKMHVSPFSFHLVEISAPRFWKILGFSKESLMKSIRNDFPTT